MQRTGGELLGRDTELDRTCALVRSGRIVTLTGVGGVGKTRLAQAVLAADGRGSAVCELGPVDEPSAVPFAVADALGFPSPDAAFAGLGGDEVLVVVDNCEHVLDAAAGAVTRLVERCPGATVLATSREALGVPGERVLALEPLALPATDAPADVAGSPAVQLLVARAAAGGADVDVDTDPAAVVALCRRLDGLPLAIELAAARLCSLTPREVLDYLDRRLGLLRRRHERGPQRHSSLEAAIQWSSERLPERTREFFECLAVFSGRFTAQQAHEVAGAPGDDLLDTVERLDLLVAQSLVTVRQQGRRSWYGLLQTLRDYARERLAERGDLHRVRDRWVDSLVATANDTRARLLHAWPSELVVTLQNTHGDVADALRWCVANDETPDRALPLFVPLCALLKRRSAMPIAELGDLVLQRWPQARHDRWAEAAAAASIAHVLRGSGERGAELARQAIDGRSSGLAGVNARRALFFHAHLAGRDRDGLRWVEEAVEVAAAHGMRPWIVELLTFRAVALASLGRIDEAIEQAGEAYRTAPAMGSPALEASAGAVQASLVALRDPVAGRAMCEQAARHCEEVDYPIGAALSLRTLGALALLAGQHAESAAFLLRALDASVGIGYSSETALTLRWVARLAHRSGRAPAAATLWCSAGRTRGDVVDTLLSGNDVDSELEGSRAPARPRPPGAGRARTELTAIAGAAPAPAGEPAGERRVNRLRREGAVWTVVFDGTTVRLPDAKGMRDLAVLFARPGREVHCTELMGAAVAQADVGPLLDAQARRAYEARIVELQGELVEAEDFGDTGRAEKLRTDMELLLAELAAATGLGGRTRHTGASTDRIRSAVSQRIRATLRRLEELHPPLGRHLRAAVHTGIWCVYRPDPPVHWDLS